MNCKLKEIPTQNTPIIEVLKSALDNVSSDYLETLYENVKKGSQKPERVFVAELYHQLRMFQEECDCKGKKSTERSFAILNNLKFNIEPLKQSRLTANNEIIDSYKFKRVIPDLI